jgi:hypothetical protein
MKNKKYRIEDTYMGLPPLRNIKNKAKTIYGKGIRRCSKCGNIYMGSKIHYCEKQKG